MIVRWGLESLPQTCAEAGVSAALLVASPRWESLELPVESVARWREVPSDRIPQALSAAEAADGVLAVGGGSAIDLGKAISAATGLPLVSVPTTYAGAEWTSYFGVRDPERRMQGGGSGAHPAAIVYEPELTLDLPAETTVGTAMNALAHCAEALYARGHNLSADEDALAGARLISDWLPRVVAGPRDHEARTELLRGACHGGAALAGSMLALAHAMAQAVGGRYGLPHGTLNGICLPPALRFNAAFEPDAIRRFGDAVGASDDPAGRVETLVALAGPRRLSEMASLKRTCRASRPTPRSAAATEPTPGSRARRRSSSYSVRSSSSGERSRVTH